MFGTIVAVLGPDVEANFSYFGEFEERRAQRWERHLWLFLGPFSTEARVERHPVPARCYRYVRSSRTHLRCSYTYFVPSVGVEVIGWEG
jgi:hypothetical protein